MSVDSFSADNLNHPSASWNLDRSEFIGVDLRDLARSFVAPRI